MLGLGEEDDALVGDIDRNDGTVAFGHHLQRLHWVIGIAFRQGRKLEPDAICFTETLCVAQVLLNRHAIVSEPLMCGCLSGASR
jgi:hypothetical protein